MQGIKSYLFTPVFCDNTLWGWIGCNDCNTERNWIAEEVHALHTIDTNVGVRLTTGESILKLKQISEKYDYNMLGLKQTTSELDMKIVKMWFRII